MSLSDYMLSITVALVQHNRRARKTSLFRVFARDARKSNNYARHKNTSLFVLFFFVLTGCATQTITLTSADVATISGAYQSNRFGICDPINVDRSGTSLYLRREFMRQLDSSAPGENVKSLAGYEVVVRRGESCHRREALAFQSALRFDLSELPSNVVRKADLIVTSGLAPLDPPYYRGSEEQCRVVRIGEALSDWEPGVYTEPPPSVRPADGERRFLPWRRVSGPDDLYLARGYGTSWRIDVSEVVSRWALGARPNHGFVLTPDLPLVQAWFGATDLRGYMCDKGILRYRLEVTVDGPE